MIENKTEFLTNHYIKNRKKFINRYGKILGDASEDVVHDAYERVLRYFDSFTGSETDFDNWFALILKNAFKDYCKFEKGFSTVDLDEFDFEGSKHSGYYNKWYSEIEKLIETKQEHHAEILRMYFKFQYTPRDISRITPNEYKNIHQVILRFKNELKALYEIK